MTNVARSSPARTVLECTRPISREKVVTRIAHVVAQITVILYAVISAMRICAMRVAYTVSVCYASFVAYFFRNFHLFQGKATDLK